MNTGRFSLCYFGPISYYSALLSYPKVVLEQYDSFTKQTYRNRSYIDSPNGELMLNISIDHNSRGLMKDTRISAKENWQQKHWQALITTYGASPFFDALAPELESFFQDEMHSLTEVNFRASQLVLKWLRYEGEVHLSESWHLNVEERDHREDFHPKKRKLAPSVAYPQVFDHKTGFKKELSVLDLIFNEGPASWDYLQQL